MNELVVVKDNDVFTDSLKIAEGTGNEHSSITRIIRKYKDDIEEFGQVGFKIRAVKYSRGTNEEKIYLLNEEQATFLLTLMRNSRKVIDFKKKLVKQFYTMRKILLEKQTAQYIEYREKGKLTRKSETSQIKQLVEYAKEQGSTHSDMLYVTYTKLVNKLTGITTREEANTNQIMQLSMMENIILNTVENDMAAGKHYKEIYKDCKDRLETFKEIAYLA